MQPSRCPKCAAAPEPEHGVCHECGTLLLAETDHESEERIQKEAWDAMAIALRGASLQGQPERPLRDRFLENMPFPRSSARLVQEALECQRFFHEDLGAETEAAQTRYRACLNRLEVLTVDEPDLPAKIEVLTRQLGRHRTRMRRNNLIVVLLLLLVFALAAGAVWLIVRGLGALVALF
jgi:hypothetical protein